MMRFDKIEIMKNQVRIVILSACMLATALLTGCNDYDGSFSVRREMIDVGQVNVGDSVSAQFTFKNKTKEQLSLSFIPECDCTTISTDNLRLQSRECGRLDVKVAVEQSGEFIKYVYVQAAGQEDFLAIAVKGRTK